MVDFDADEINAVLEQERELPLKLVGKSAAMRDLLSIIRRAAPTPWTVLISGETGTGKELIARLLHLLSPRREHPFVAINCAAMPENLVESELFGHEKGSFTGAHEERKGYFEIADGGTLFLDEIAEMSLTTQVKLLRVLETNEFMRIGSERVTKVDVRIIAATNKDLQQEVNSKTFRNDLYFRLKAVTLTIPPLRDRKEDIIPLTDNFIANYSEKYKLPEFKLTRDAIDLLLSYSWPGNVRELKNAVESALALSKTELITAQSFNSLIQIDDEDKEISNLPIHLDRPSDVLDREMIYRALIEIKKDLIDLKKLAEKNIDSSGSMNENIDVNEVVPIDRLEHEAIINALNFTKWNKKKAAELLKISERTLYRKIKEYEIN
ncbi:MAG: sigma-54-dependent Fis family transcriptional regulator [Melioribacteraceae bacterium]|nr:sigma-54-dependent Fis family transcriptional regulator [Melioribacteraceae bacterium]